MSQFGYIQGEWPALHEAAAKAESLVYPDPGQGSSPTMLAKLGPWLLCPLLTGRDDPTWRWGRLGFLAVTGWVQVCLL